MPADIARTVDDVRRLAPTAGWYWVSSKRKWVPAQLMVGPSGVARIWVTFSGQTGKCDADMKGHQIIGPILPPDAPA